MFSYFQFQKVKKKINNSCFILYVYNKNTGKAFLS